MWLLLSVRNQKESIRSGGYKRSRSKLRCTPLIKIAADVNIYDANTFAFAQLLSGFVVKLHDLRNDAFQRGAYLNKHT